MSDITGGQGDVGRGRHALLHHGVRKWTQTHWQVSRLATREAHRQGSVPHDASVTVSSKTLPSSSTNIPSVSLSPLGPDFKTGGNFHSKISKNLQ